MVQIRIKKYLLNCFLLLIPIFLWNILLVGYLPKSYSPEIFWKDVPKFIGFGENVLRIIVFVFPAIMILSLKTRLQKIGLLIYFIGLILYFLSWAIMIVRPESNWSLNLIGFMAPAFTTIIWFVGIAIIGNKAYFKIPYLTFIYSCLSVLFVLFHSAHAYIVFQNLYI